MAVLMRVTRCTNCREPGHYRSRCINPAFVAPEPEPIVPPDRSAPGGTCAICVAYVRERILVMLDGHDYAVCLPCVEETVPDPPMSYAGKLPPRRLHV